MLPAIVAVVLCNERPQENTMLKFLRKTLLYILAVPFLSICLGVASNQVVLITNHDRFPVSVNIVKLHKFVDEDEIKTLDDGVTMIDEVHCVASNKTHLNMLGDIFDKHDSISSIGDELQDLGYYLWDYCLVLWCYLVSLKLAVSKDE